MRKIKYVVIHWDASLSSQNTLNTLKKRGLSVHFLIDADGTIIRSTPIDKIAYHAKYCNKHSIGIEINNPVKLKYQDIDNPRPIMSDVKVHGKILDNFLGFYPEQILSLKNLCKSLNLVLGIPLVCPIGLDGEVATSSINMRKFKTGFLAHYHIPRKDGKIKKDPAGLDIKKILEEIS